MQRHGAQAGESRPYTTRQSHRRTGISGRVLAPDFIDTAPQLRHFIDELVVASTIGVAATRRHQAGIIEASLLRDVSHKVVHDAMKHREFRTDSRSQKGKRRHP